MFSHSSQQVQKATLPDHEIAYNRAKVALLSKPNTTFYTSLLFSMEQLWDNSQPTAYTAGTVIAYNTDFFMKLTLDERVFLMLHEVSHVALQHHDRLGSKNPARWNQACDHVINLALIEAGFSMPTSLYGDTIGLADDRFKGMSSEQVYAILESENAPLQGMPDIRPGPPGQTPDQVREQVNDMVVRASIRAQQAADDPKSIPTFAQILLDKLLKPKFPWYQILYRFMKEQGKANYSFRKPNRRHFPANILPSLHSNKLGKVTAMVDASGSVADVEFTRFISELAGVLRAMKPREIEIVTFDTEIREVQSVDNVLDISKLQFTGRGGTDIQPAIEYIEKNPGDITLIFTDGEFCFHRSDTTYKGHVIWLIHHNPQFTAPYGKVIHYET